MTAMAEPIKKLCLTERVPTLRKIDRVLLNLHWPNIKFEVPDREFDHAVAG